METLPWLVSLLLLQHCYSRIDECPKVKYCECHKHSMYCNGYEKDLRSIPRAPHYIVEVHLKDIQLGEVTRAMVNNLTHCKMTSLYLKDNNISQISPDAFQDLSYLRLLDWQQEDLPITDIEAMLQHVTSGLETIRLKGGNVYKSAMNASVFQKITKLISLTISLKQLVTFDASGFSTMMNLQTLDLSNNLLNSIIFNNRIPIANITTLNIAGNNFITVPELCRDNISAAMPRLWTLNLDNNGIRQLNVSSLTCLHNLLKLSLAGNDFVRIPELCRVDLPPVTPSLRTLDLDDNAIRELDVSSLTCLHNLLKLSLSSNRIEVLQDNAFANLPRLNSLQISKMLVLKRIERLAFNSTSLYKIYFAMNPILSRKNFDPRTLFAHTPNLGSLDMFSTKMDITVSDLKAFLLNLKNIETLILQDTYIKELPYGVFSQLKKLTHLVLSGNYFSGWNDTVFANVTNIKRIFFDGCNIKTISERSFPLSFRLSVNEIDLANNALICTCDLLWFRNWMKAVIANKSIVFSQYPRRYECRGPNVKRLRLENFNPTVKSCTPIPFYIFILATVLPIIAVTVVTGAVIYRFRWYLLYWVSLLRRKRHKQYDIIKEYDAFVSYSNPDYDWVEKELLDYLEAKGMKLLEHSRDFQLGKLIVDNVLDAMDTSRKTILVISNEYMKSSWCQFELQMAFNGSLKNECELVVILLEPIKARQMTSTLRALMTSTTYLQWSGDDGALLLFQRRLEERVRE